MHINKNELNILRASTYGTGVLIKHALDSGCQEIILGVGAVPPMMLQLEYFRLWVEAY